MNEITSADNMSDEGSGWPGEQSQNQQGDLHEQSDSDYESHSDEDDEYDCDIGEWCPGDGICPSTAQFNECYQASFDTWRHAASTRSKDSESICFYINALLDLLRDVPRFLHCPPDGVKITGKSKGIMILQSSLQLETTDDSSCDQRQKTIKYLQCLGFPKPATYRVKKQRQSQVAIPTCASPLRSGYFTSIVLAWSYIISCRWVEILSRQAKKLSSYMIERKKIPSGR